VTITSYDVPGDDDRPSPEEARAIVLGQLAEWLAAGKSRFTPHELNHALNRAGRSRRWIFALLAELRDRGVIIAGDVVGDYTITRSPLGDG
jgi:hypothetical protein